jgi:hypothetical protein
MAAAALALPLEHHLYHWDPGGAGACSCCAPIIGPVLFEVLLPACYGCSKIGLTLASPLRHLASAWRYPAPPRCVYRWRWRRWRRWWRRGQQYCAGGCGCFGVATGAPPVSLAMAVVAVAPAAAAARQLLALCSSRCSCLHATDAARSGSLSLRHRGILLRPGGTLLPPDVCSWCRAASTSANPAERRPGGSERYRAASMRLWTVRESWRGAGPSRRLHALLALALPVAPSRSTLCARRGNCRLSIRVSFWSGASTSRWRQRAAGDRTFMRG